MPAMLPTRRLVCIYEGNLIGQMQLLATSCDPELITIAMQKMLPHTNRPMRRPRTRKRRGKENGRNC